jgi:hypothetical protein
VHLRRGLSPRLAIPLAVALLVALAAGTASRESDEMRQVPSERLYSATSPLNLTVPAGAKVDPQSAAMVSRLAEEVDEKGWAISTKAYTVPVFQATASTERTTVRVRTRGTVHRVAIPDDAFPSPGSDGHLAVIDANSGCEYDFYRGRRLADGSWEAENFNALPTSGSGIYPRGLATRASGFANAAGLIRASEIRRGRIDHALVFSMPSTRAGGPVRPATSSDGSTSGAGAIPEGARLQLDPALSIDRLAPWQRVIARALQRYGMYLADTGGAVALYAQHPRSADDGFRYPWGDVTYGYMPKWLARHLHVLELPPQRPSIHRFVPNRCLARP